MPTLADQLARYSRTLRYQDLSGSVVHEVKRRILDSLGCAFGAWNATPCRIARRLAESVTVPGGATLWGTSHKTLPDLAAFANGALVRYLDFNDTYLAKEPAHPSDNIPAVFAVAESAGAAGKRVIQAIALAYEIHCRLCDAAALRPRGWDHVTYGPFSTALAAAHVLELSEEQTRQAVNLAGVANIALRQTRVGDLSMWKACAFSNAARNGIFAALLAQHKLTGPAPIFEGAKGFMKLVSGPFELRMEQGAAKILETYIKHYPVEYHAQTAVEAALELRKELFNAEGPEAVTNITAVMIDSYDVAIEIIGRDPEKWQPKTRETADHSFPYCVAAALLDGTITVRSFAATRVQDPGIRALMEKVRACPLQEFVGRYPEAMPTRITVHTKSGRQYRAQVDYPLGHPKHPMSDAQVEEKFRRLAGPRLNRARADKVIDLVWKLDRLTDIGAFARLVKVGH
jgi:2-methylcitrate dehydratase